MSRSILVVDPDAEFFRQRLEAAFRGLEVKAVRSTDEALPYVGEAEVFAGLPRFFRDDMVREATKLKWIQVFTTGTDHITSMKSLKGDTLVTSTRGMP